LGAAGAGIFGGGCGMWEYTGGAGAGAGNRQIAIFFLFFYWRKRKFLRLRRKVGWGGVSAWPRLEWNDSRGTEETYS
jgi:hypothetical protein